MKKAQGVSFGPFKMATMKKRRLWYFLSFLEGGSVMVAELVGAKMLAPWFGTSLYVWAAVLGITLGGLMSGYFLGGVLTRKFPREERLLYLVLLLAGTALLMMPVVGPWIMDRTVSMSLQAGTVVSLLVFLLPPLVFMGMTSPIIIHLLTQDADEAGNSAGNVYAISTLGGILFTFLMGFYLMPHFGISMPAAVMGVVLALFPALLLVKSGGRPSVAALLLPAAVAGATLYSGEHFSADYHVLYESEGIFGQVKVVDHPSYEITADARPARALMVNNTMQTLVGRDHDMQYSVWSWAHFMPTVASIYPPGSRALVLGLGGGTLVKQFKRLGFDVEAVEIDPRIHQVSIQYFNMPADVPVTIDDARHFIRTCQRKYDIIVFDTFLGESVPEHLLTIEGFEQTKRLLNPGGMVMINFYGFIHGREGRAARCVYKTLLQSGFQVEVLATPGKEANRNLIFLASLEEKDFAKANYQEPGFDKIADLYSWFLNPYQIDTADAVVLTDNRPVLSMLYAPAALHWRKSYNDYYRRHFHR